MKLNDFIAQQGTGFAAAVEDAADRFELVGQLRERRKHLDLSQKLVADRMGTTQSAISDVESGTSDPRLSTLQRYATALEHRLHLELRPMRVVWNSEPCDTGLRSDKDLEWHGKEPLREVPFYGAV